MKRLEPLKERIKEMRLRDYQTRGIEKLREALRSGKKRPLLVAPTGSGKSIIYSQVIKSVIENGKRVLWIVHRRNLVTQMQETLKRFGIEAGIIMAGIEPDWESPVQLCTIQTFGRRMDLEPDEYNPWMVKADVVLIDEGHRSVAPTYRKVIDEYQDRIIMACTATPCRADGRGLGEVYDSLVDIASVRELTEQGYLAPARYFAPVNVDLEGVRTKMGDYVVKDLDGKMVKTKLIGDILENWLRLAENRKTIVYAVNVKHSKAICEEFQKHGVAAEHLDAHSSDDERDRVFAKMERGELTVITNVALYCLDEKTEILTGRGWKGINELDMNSSIANWTSDGTVYFDKPGYIVKRQLYDDEFFVSVQTKSSDIRITNNHNVVCKAQSEGAGTWIKRKAEELIGKVFTYPIAGSAKPKTGYITKPFMETSRQKAIRSNSYTIRKRWGLSLEESKKIAAENYDRRSKLRKLTPEELSLDQCRLIGFWLGDGHTAKLKKGGKEVLLFQSERYPKIVEWVDELLDRLKLDYKRNTRENTLNGNHYAKLVMWGLPRGTGGYSQGRRGIYSIEEYLNKDGSDLYWGLDDVQFRGLMEGFHFADGEHKEQKTKRIKNTNKNLLDLLQAICVCRGIGASVIKDKTPDNKNHNQQWALLYEDGRVERTVAGRFRLNIDENRTGKVWCVKSTSGMIITRRNGRVCITGNTEGLDVPDVSCIVMARPTKSLGLYRQCVDSQTKILTEVGFLGPDEISIYDKVAGFNLDSGEITWEEILSITDRDTFFYEKMYSIENPHIDLRVTDGHNMIYTGGRSKAGWTLKRADYLSRHKDGYRIPVSGNQKFKGVKLTDDEIRFLGLYLTDGWWCKSTGAITICQSDHHIEEVEYIDKCLECCGFKYSRKKRKRNTPFKENGEMIYWTVSKGKPRKFNKHLRGWGELISYVGKNINWRLDDMDHRQFGVFLEAINVGDGTKNRGDYVYWEPKTTTIITGNKGFASNLQIMAVRRGYRCNVSYADYKNAYRIYLKKQNFSSVGGINQTDRKSQLKDCSTGHRERVWCVENKTGAIIVRRNGKVAIVGNCAGRGLRPSKEWPDCLILDHGNVIETHGLLDWEMEWTLDGKERAWKKPSRAVTEKLVKCRACHKVFMGASVCPDCGTPVKSFGKKIETIEAELEEIDAKEQTWSMADKRRWFGMFEWHRRSKGYQRGWTAHKYREKTGVWPKGMDDVIPIEPDDEFRNWIRYLNIRYAKRKQKEQAEQHLKRGGELAEQYSAGLR